MRVTAFAILMALLVAFEACHGLVPAGLKSYALRRSRFAYQLSLPAQKEKEAYECIGSNGMEFSNASEGEDLAFTVFGEPVTLQVSN